MIEIEELPKVRIKISEKKCPTPFACQKCLNICPAGVFMVVANPMKTVTKFTPIDENEPGSYMLVAPMASKCIGCNKCIDICPNQALKIKYKYPVEESSEEPSAA
ncbi:MAG: 4Fe-4S binding protein [Candidatus Helarchaeota archaeon]|nr:4Fe-4S binding protein [Candidatus Helarchaeota archaeon]